MVTIYKVEKSNIEGEGKFLVELRGLSDDDKPTTLNGGTIQNGSTYTEIDTGDKYMYDLENTTWYKVESGNGGSEPMEKFDYVIPSGLDLSELSSGDEITNSDVLSVLNEIKTYIDEEFNPVLIGLFYYDSDGNNCFAINTEIQYYGELEKLFFTTKTGIIYLKFESDKWYYYTV